MYLYYSGLEGQVLDQIELIHGSTAQITENQVFANSSATTGASGTWAAE